MAIAPPRIWLASACSTWKYNGTGETRSRVGEICWSEEVILSGQSLDRLAEHHTDDGTLSSACVPKLESSCPADRAVDAVERVVERNNLGRWSAAALSLDLRRRRFQLGPGQRCAAVWRQRLPQARQITPPFPFLPESGRCQLLTRPSGRRGRTLHPSRRCARARGRPCRAPRAPHRGAAGPPSARRRKVRHADEKAAGGGLQRTTSATAVSTRLAAWRTRLRSMPR